MTSPSGKSPPRPPALATVHAPAHPQHPPGGPHEGPGRRYGWALAWLRVALLAAAYLGAAKVGLTMAFVAEQVTAVWPPTGIALAALLWRREHFGK